MSGDNQSHTLDVAFKTPRDTAASPRKLRRQLVDSRINEERAKLEENQRILIEYVHGLVVNHDWRDLADACQRLIATEQALLSLDSVADG